MGLVGVGEMGFEIARRLVGHHELRAFARRADVAAQLRAASIEAVPTIVEAVDGATVVVLCVRTDDQVVEVCGLDRPEPGLLGHLASRSVLVVHTTGSPRTAERLAEATRGSGVHVLDAPFSGPPSDVRNGSITLLTGGSTVALETAKAVLSTYADPILHLGPVGAGQRFKLLNNLLLAANVDAAASALDAAAAAGIEPVRFADVVRECSGSSFAMTALGGRPGAVDAIGALIAKDIDVALHAAADDGVDLGQLGELARHAAARFERGAAREG